MYLIVFCLKKKTNILIPIEFLMEQFRIVPHSTSKGRKKRNQENCVLIEANEQSLPLSTPFPAAIKMHPSSASSFFLNVSRIELQQKKQKTKETETHTKQLYRTWFLGGGLWHYSGHYVSSLVLVFQKVLYVLLLFKLVLLLLLLSTI